MNGPFVIQQRVRRTGLFLGLALTYYIVGRLGLHLAFVNASATAVWPPTGIALAALLIMGFWTWPAVFLGAFFVNLLTSGSWPASLGIALGNTLEGLAGAYLIQRYATGRQAFDAPASILKFTGLAGIAAAISASVGVCTLRLTALANPGSTRIIWMTWWLGDVTGALIVAPFVILWTNPYPAPWTLRDSGNAILMAVSVFFCGMVVFGGWFPPPVNTFPLEFICIPMVIWAAFRFGSRAAMTTTLAFSAIAVGGTLHGNGPFLRSSQNTSLLLLQIFMGVTAITGLIVGSILDRQRRAEEALRRNEADLERIVEERTAELRLKEEELLQKRTMEAIGRLAGGVAHDFNNILMGVLGSSEIIETQLSPSDLQLTELKEIQKAVKRAVSLTKQLLAFGRKQTMVPQILNVNAFVTDTTHLLRRLMGEDIQFATELDPALGFIKADPGQLDQVFLNLAANARDAMPQGGKLVLRTSNFHLDLQNPQMDLKAGDYVMITITDTGVGMSQDVLAHIFEPFYTTKEKDKGTGLGLATVYGIIKQLDGSITVYSQLQYGTTFKIFLPRIDEGAERPHAPAASQEVPPSKGSESILVVEDDELVANRVSRTLQQKGYSVMMARSGREALDLMAVRGRAVHLLLTDVIMPEMNGRQLAQQITRRYPSIKVLYMSGYPEEIISRQGVLNPGIAFIEKPFSSAQLLEKIRSLLDPRSS